MPKRLAHSAIFSQSRNPGEYDANRSSNPRNHPCHTLDDVMLRRAAIRSEPALSTDSIPPNSGVWVWNMVSTVFLIQFCENKSVWCGDLPYCSDFLSVIQRSTAMSLTCFSKRSGPTSRSSLRMNCKGLRKPEPEDLRSSR